MWAKRSTLLISSRPAIIKISRPYELLETPPPPQQLYTLSPCPLMRPNSSPRLSPRCTRISSMYSLGKRLRTCLLIVSLIIKFTLRITRHLHTATSTHSLEQSLVSFVSSSTICLAKDSSDHPSPQQVPQSCLKRRK